MMRFVVPAYNEGQNVDALLDALTPVALAHGARVFVVDDGSTDDTVARLEARAGELDLVIVRHAGNRGLGAAVRTGLTAALEGAADDDPIVTIEADTTSDLGDLAAMLARFADGADVVLASVHAAGGSIVGVAGWRVLSSRTISTAFRYLGDIRKVHTLSGLYRIYRAGALRRAGRTYGALLIREPGFAVNVELLLKLDGLGARIEEVPTTNDWRSRRGTSKMRTLPTLRGYGRVLVADLAERVQPAPPPLVGPGASPGD